MNETIQFFVAGTPVAQGSKTLMRGRMIDSNPKLKPWRNAVALEARRYGQNKITGPVRLSVSFMFERPKSQRYCLGSEEPGALIQIDVL
jgi:Holliday junction resolvase RusA-like endonuclease